MNQRHLSDDRLIEFGVSGTPPAGDEQAHLAACPACEARRVSVVEILADLDTAADLNADVAFPPERLERQQARILHRVEQDGRPGRLISFPAHQTPGTILRSRPRVRWAAAAAAAAFVFGLLAGHFAHTLTVADQAQSAGVIGRDTTATPMRAVSTTFSEDEFLGQVELAATQSGPVALRPLDVMTPRAWDVR